MYHHFHRSRMPKFRNSKSITKQSKRGVTVVTGERLFSKCERRFKSYRLVTAAGEGWALQDNIWVFIGSPARAFCAVGFLAVRNMFLVTLP